MEALPTVRQQQRDIARVKYANPINEVSAQDHACPYAPRPIYTCARLQPPVRGLILSYMLPLLLTLTLICPATAYFCSASCAPNGCLDTSASSCSTCDFPFLLDASTCIIDPQTPYWLLAQGTDIALNTSGTSTCGPYDFNGGYNSNTSILITGPTPVGSHVAIRLIAWVIFSSDWLTTDSLSITLLSTSQTATISLASHDGESNECGSSKPEWYIKIDQQFTHTDESSPVVFSLVAYHQGTTRTWGIKDIALLAADCHSFCSSCLTPSQSDCSSCSSGYWLSDTTCSDSCLPYYGASSSWGICIECDSYCLSCSQIQTNCTQCVESGLYESFLLDNQCLVECPSYYFQNSTTHQCDLCDDQFCLICSTNSSAYCLQCNSSAYYLNASCYQQCPQGYYQDNQNCTQCPLPCSNCQNSSSCTSCQATFFLFEDQCGDCPSDYFGLDGLCLDCDSYCVTATLSMYSKASHLYIDIEFTRPFALPSPQRSLFQTISFSSSFSLADFTASYTIPSPALYRIILTPKSKSDFTNLTVTVDINDFTAPYFSDEGYQISPNVSLLSSSVEWNYSQQAGVTFLDRINYACDSIEDRLCSRWAQESVKSGLFLFISPATFFSSLLLFAGPLPHNMYTACRAWAIFLLFQVPPQNSNASHAKYFLGSQPISNITKNRLLQKVSQEGWRFERTGFTSLLVLDAYLPMMIMALMWMAVLLVRKCNGQKARRIRSCLYEAFHCWHQITLFYLLLGATLNLFYSQDGSAMSRVSTGFSIFFLVYYAAYVFYVFYHLIPSPYIHSSSYQFEPHLQKYSYFLANIRLDDYGCLNSWDAHHLFRPYNYKILRLIRSALMLAYVPFFQDSPLGCISIIAIIQLVELLRFLCSWPYCSLWRNLFQFCIELAILAIFITSIAISVQSTPSETLGWLGFGLIFGCNLSFIVLTLINVVQRCRYSMMEQVQRRRNLHRQYLEKQASGYNSLGDMKPKLNAYYRFLHRLHGVRDEGNGVETRNIEMVGLKEEQQYIEAWKINIVIESYQIKRISQTYEIEVYKVSQLRVSQNPSPSTPDNVIRVGELHTTLLLDESDPSPHSQLFPPIFNSYARTPADLVVLTTHLYVNQNLFKPGSPIPVLQSHLSQQVELRGLETICCVKLGKVREGFPLSMGLFG